MAKPKTQTHQPISAAQVGPSLAAAHSPPSSDPAPSGPVSLGPSAAQRSAHPARFASRLAPLRTPHPAQASSPAPKSPRTAWQPDPTWRRKPARSPARPLSRLQHAPPLTRGPSLPASASPSRSYRRASRRRSRAAPSTVRIPRIPAGPFIWPLRTPKSLTLQP